jgi:uncharacterized membrane protein
VIWAAVLATAAGCYLLKVTGWFVPASVLERPRVRAAAALLPVALLSALVVVQVFADGRSLQVDARAASLAAGAVCLWRRLPFLVVVLVAAGTAALIRAA